MMKQSTIFDTIECQIEILDKKLINRTPGY